MTHMPTGAFAPRAGLEDVLRRSTRSWQSVGSTAWPSARTPSLTRRIQEEHRATRPVLPCGTRLPGGPAELVRRLVERATIGRRAENLGGISSLFPRNAGAEPRESVAARDARGAALSDVQSCRADLSARAVPVRRWRHPSPLGYLFAGCPGRATPGGARPGHHQSVRAPPQPARADHHRAVAPTTPAGRARSEVAAGPPGWACP